MKQRDQEAFEGAVSSLVDGVRTLEWILSRTPRRAEEIARYLVERLDDDEISVLRQLVKAADGLAPVTLCGADRPPDEKGAEPHHP